MYKIRVRYQTGDSFKTWDESTTLDFIWANVNVAKENLKRIQDHYKWYVEKDKFDCGRSKKRPDRLAYCDPKYDMYLAYRLDDGTESEYKCASWCGYFETLYGADIISDPEDGWSFEL